MRKLYMLVLAILLISPLTLFAQKTGTAKFKCMIQMTNYMGEGAYIAVSLIDSKDAYVKTLYILGQNKKWYHDLKEWHKFQSKNTDNISAITGASVTGGDRSVGVIEIDNAKINAGYKIRFESAVEDQKYNVKDLEVPLTTEALAGKSEGTGYIRYVRFSAI